MRNTLPLVALVASIGIGFAGVSAAQTASTTAGQAGQNVMFKMRGMHGLSAQAGEKPGVVGKVTAVNGTTITVESMNPMDDTTTIYSIDAASAKVLTHTDGAGPTETSLAAVVVGDMVAVRGTVSGTHVTATEIIDGLPAQAGVRGKGAMFIKKMGPGVQGTVTAVSGNTVTLTGADGKTYAVDASDATIAKMITITVGQIAVGDTLGVHGTVSGTNVEAKHIMDGLPAQAGLPKHDEIRVSN